MLLLYFDLCTMDFNVCVNSHGFSAPVQSMVQSPSHSSAQSQKSPLPHSPFSSAHTSPLHTTTVATIEDHPSHETPPTPPTSRGRSVSPSLRVSPPVAGEHEGNEGAQNSRLGSPLLSKLSPLLGVKKGRVKTRE